MHISATARHNIGIIVLGTAGFTSLHLANPYLIQGADKAFNWLSAATGMEARARADIAQTAARAEALQAHLCPAPK